MSEPSRGRSRTNSEESSSSNRSNLSSSSRRAPSPAVPSFRFRRSSRSSKELTDESGAADVALYKEGVPKQEGDLQAGPLDDSARDPYEGPSHTTTEDYAVSHQGGAGESEEIDLLGPRPAGGDVDAGGATLVAGGIARPDEDGECSEFSPALGGHRSRLRRFACIAAILRAIPFSSYLKRTMPSNDLQWSTSARS